MPPPQPRNKDQGPARTTAGTPWRPPQLRLGVGFKLGKTSGSGSKFNIFGAKTLVKLGVIFLPLRSLATKDYAYHLSSLFLQNLFSSSTVILYIFCNSYPCSLIRPTVGNKFYCYSFFLFFSFFSPLFSFLFYILFTPYTKRSTLTNLTIGTVQI